MPDDVEQTERPQRGQLMRSEVQVARYVPPYSMRDLDMMADAVVNSHLFGITSKPQALTLMLLAQAEGRHPVLAARDYHIIEGRPSKTAEAMVRDYLASGGEIEWQRLDDECAEAIFSHPRGGTSPPIRWDIPRARQAGLLGRRGDMYSKYPRAMLRSRCVSEGIRTIWPAATSGMYVPEETEEIAPRRPRAMKDVTPPPAAEPYDPETGEISEAFITHSSTQTPDPLPVRARRMAGKGTEMLRNWLQDLSRDDRVSLRELIGSAEAPGALLTLARQADAEASHQRLRHPMGAGVASGDTRSLGERTPQAREEAAPATDTPPSELGSEHAPTDAAQDAPAAIQTPAGPGRSSLRPPQRAQRHPPSSAADAPPAGPPPPSDERRVQPEAAPDALRPHSSIWDDEVYTVPLRDAHGGPDWQDWLTRLRYLCEEATTPQLEQLKRDNRDTLQRLKVSDRALYDEALHEFERGRGGRPE
jgi:hypothetical protein